MAVMGADSRLRQGRIRLWRKQTADRPRSTLHSSLFTATRRRGLSTIEYTALLAVVAATLWQLSVYTMRALCGRWRQVGDQFGYGRQYDPGETKVTVSP